VSEKTKRLQPVGRDAWVGRETFIGQDVPCAEESRGLDELVCRRAERLRLAFGGDDHQHAPIERVGEPGHEIRANGVGDRHPVSPAVENVAEDVIALPPVEQLPKRCGHVRSCRENAE
jgi:hypothetical protein